MKKGAWCFAIIADLHIGCFYPDYGLPGWRAWGESGQGEEYFLTERLRRTVQWINRNRELSDCPLRFVAVLGDLTDSAEWCELVKAKEILDLLEVPYIPLLGNHDIWPYTDFEQADAPLGAENFYRAFADRFASLSHSEVIEEWEMDSATVQGTPLANYAFKVGGIRFLALDCVNRERLPGTVGASPVGVFHPRTREWIEEHLSSWGNQPVVILSHHQLSGYLHRPPGIDVELWNKLQLFAYVTFLPTCYPEIEATMRGRENILATFAAHNHSCHQTPLGQIICDVNHLDLYPVEGKQVILTEAVVAGSNQKGKGTIRLVRVDGDSTLDWRRVEGDGRPALNPSFSYLHLDENTYIFTPSTFTARKVELRWDFGDGETTPWLPWEGEAGTGEIRHRFSPKRESHKVTLSFRERGDTSFSESMTLYI